MIIAREGQREQTDEEGPDQGETCDSAAFVEVSLRTYDASVTLPKTQFYLFESNQQAQVG